MDKNGVSWSYCRLAFTCFPLSSFCFLSCFHAFPVTVSVGFLSAFVSFCWSRLFFPILFFLLLHLHFVKFLLSACKYSFHPAVSFSRLVLRSGTKPKRRQQRRQNSRQLRMNLARSRQTFFPILLLLRQLPLPLRGLVFAAGIYLTSTSKAPTAPASPRLLLLLLMQLLLMLMLMVLVLVAAGSCCCDLL